MSRNNRQAVCDDEIVELHCLASALLARLDVLLAGVDSPREEDVYDFCEEELCA